MNWGDSCASSALSAHTHKFTYQFVILKCLISSSTQEY